MNVEAASERGRLALSSEQDSFEALFKAQYAAAWLYRASAHTALNRVRGRRRREKREHTAAHDEAGQALDPQSIAEANEERRVLRSALARLPQKPAAVLVLRSSGLSYSEVAEAIG